MIQTGVTLAAQYGMGMAVQKKLAWVADDLQ